MLSRAPKRGIDRSVADLALMTAALLLVFAFGANGLNTDPIWTDELYSITNMGGFDPPFGPAEIIGSVAKNSPDHVPLFFLLGAAWAQFVGWTQFALRLMPVLAGVLMIAWMYRLGSDMFGRFAGRLAAILLGASAYIVLYLHDFRMYALFLMLATTHMWIYWRIAMKRSKHVLMYAAFVGSALALLYTHVFSFILISCLGLYHLLMVGKSRRWLKVCAGWCVAFLLFAPYLPLVINGVQSAAEKGRVTDRAAEAPELLATILMLLGNGSWMVIAAMGFVMVFACARHRPTSLLKFMLVPIAMLILIISLNEIIGIIPIKRMRYFLIVWIPTILVMSGSLSLMPKRELLSLMMLVIWCGSGYQFYRSTTILNHVGSMVQTRLYPSAQDYVYHLQGKVRPQDYLVGFTNYDYFNTDLRLGNSVADYYTQLQLGIDGAFIRQTAHSETLDRLMQKHIDDQPFLLLAYDPRREPNNFAQVMATITHEYNACAVLIDLPDLFVQRYVNAMLDCERQYAPIIYENGVTIVDRFARYAPEENRVQILTGWEVDNEALLNLYNVSLQIITPDWQLMEQNDRHLYDDILKWDESELSTARLAPGDYRVVVIVYDRETVKKVRGTDSVTGLTGEMFPILHFSVES